MASIEYLLAKIKEATERGIIGRDTVIFHENGIGWRIHNIQAGELDPRPTWISNDIRSNANETGKHPILELGPFGTKKTQINVIITDKSEMCRMVIPEHLAEQLDSTDELSVAQRAPIAPITLVGQARDVANIPQEATHFTWLYPPAGFTQESKAVKKSINKLVTSGDFQSTFLALGGFAYLNSDHDPIKTVQINCLVKAETGLTFEGPFPWKSEFTECLQRHGRFQSVTIAELIAHGITYYCFINPNENLTDFRDENRKWKPAPNGAFVYLYNSDMKPHKFDCFFRVADTPAKDRNTGLVQPFTIILEKSLKSRFRDTNSEPSRTSSTMSSQDIPEQYLCAICKVETIRCLFMPCRHLCACNSCAKKLAEDNYTRCPLCNEVFQDIWNVFL